MSEIKEMEEKVQGLQAQVQKLEKLSSLGVLSAGIAHEIQNPLNFVINFSQMSKDMVDDLLDLLEDTGIQMPSKNDDDEFQKIIGTLRSYLDKIAEHGQRATDIIQGILLYSRGKEDEYMKTDIQRLLKEYVWLSYHAMRANLKDFNVTIHESYDSSIPEMNIIPQDFSRAILNLMNNSCYAVWKKQLTAGEEYVPTIKVEAILADNQLKISIEDNGIGMSEEVRQHIFTAFFTTKPAGEGTGLGLSITEDIIVNKHKGCIMVESEDGKFTRFIIFIPIV